VQWEWSLTFSKTEPVVLTKGTKSELQNSIGSELFRTGKKIKVLGIIFDEKITRNSYITKVIGKRKKLNSALRFIRWQLNRDQFLKVLRCQFYSACFYAFAVWLHGINPYKDIRRINAVYYRSLRIASKDYKKKLPKSKLDELGRARPTMWARYQSTSIVIKAITRMAPPKTHKIKLIFTAIESI